MPRIKTVTPDQAQGVIKEGYEMFMSNMGTIPKPMEMMSVSPKLFESQLSRIHYFSTHPNLSFALLAHIRYLVAHHLDYSFCMDFNRALLKKAGVDDENIAQIEQDPSKSMLEANENDMLAFVIKSVKAPASVTDKDVQSLKDAGWTDTDMVDALAQGVSMIDHAIMMQVFDMGQNCTV